jgi:hypothetical protein
MMKAERCKTITRVAGHRARQQNNAANTLDTNKIIASIISNGFYARFWHVQKEKR